jgi:uncharacterized protein (TIGR02001 family)
MKKIIVIFCLTFFVQQDVSAQQPLRDANDPIEFSSNIGFVSDYIFRGISQTDTGVAVQGGFDASHDSGFYAGVWGSNVDFNDGDSASSEIDLYGGYSFPFKGLNVDLGAIYYAYPNSNSDLDYDFFEVYAGVAMEEEKFDIGASVNYAPENFGDSGSAVYTALTADYKVTDNLKVKSDIGYQIIDDADAFGTDDYLHWGIGLEYHYKGFDALIKYSQSDLDVTGSCGSTCDPKIIFGISRSF